MSTDCTYHILNSKRPIKERYTLQQIHSHFVPFLSTMDFHEQVSDATYAMNQIIEAAQSIIKHSKNPNQIVIPHHFSQLNPLYRKN